MKPLYDSDLADRLRYRRSVPHTFVPLKNNSPNSICWWCWNHQWYSAHSPPVIPEAPPGNNDPDHSEPEDSSND